MPVYAEDRVKDAVRAWAKESAKRKYSQDMNGFMAPKGLDAYSAAVMLSKIYPNKVAVLMVRLQQAEDEQFRALRGEGMVE